MECVALTGISRQVIRELLANGIRTLEIRSPNNFIALLQSGPGDVIFLTEASGPDVVTVKMLNTLYGLNVDTTELEERADEIELQMQKLAEQVQSSSAEEVPGRKEMPFPMYG